MKTKILNINGEKGKEITLPKCFSAEIREDIVARVIEVKKIWQPYGVHPGAGMEYSASGKLNHRRNVWKSQYKRGISRVPRKIFTRKGSQFNWEGATVPNTRGGRRAHPPKSISMINTKKINKKELRIAFESALSATANAKKIVLRYARLKGEKLQNIPFVVESKFVSLKTKDLLSSLNGILGKKLFEVATKTKKVRAGKGKLRGRKYKSSAGMLIVVGEKEKLKTTHFQVINVKNLGVEDLADGGVGRLTLYTEEAIKYLEGRK